ncbi:OmpA family protein [Acinetobacter higginsii]|uniref:OmpA family protein n=1 Tax=Acinetobacter higginsii TaxID=70347 RepID=UPI002675E8F7|nr:OmpA family protein [Acinetobacter higginsii]MDO3665056.1 OmpA family protein [Acinetobacter higginsii]
MNKKLSSVMLMTAIISLTTIGCSKKQEKHEAAETSAPTTEHQSVETQSKTASFSIDQIPISNVELGDFPFIQLPKGYHFAHQSTENFAQMEFWVGDKLEKVEGQLFNGRIDAEENNKQASFLELQRNLDAVIGSLGGKKITDSKIPTELSTQLSEKYGVAYVDGLGDIYNNPTQSYVIHQNHRDIWFQITQSGLSAGLLVLETRPIEITAQALSANQLKAALDQNHKVDIQINFETDKATLLADSHEQITQILNLLKSDDALKLEINGYTDNSGESAHNLKLSQARAQTVVKALTDAGIDPSRLKAQGFGDTKPVSSNESEEGKAKNRRVELVKL